jgi:cytochrome P450/UDP:flavonoid glycosyltransferase YjiC (YdhE family)
MRITLFAHGTRGDVAPMVALGWQLARRDHDVTVTVPAEFREFTERAGLRTAPLPFDLTAWLSTAEGQRLLHRGGIRLMRRMTREYSRHADAFDEAYEAAAQGAEALVGTILTYDRALVLGDALRIPVATVYQVPIGLSSEYPSLLMTRGGFRSSLVCRGSHELAERLWWRGTAQTTNAFRQKLGLPRCSKSTFRRLQHPGALGLHTFSPSLFPRPGDWGDHLEITGAWEMPAALRSSLGEELPADLQAWLDAGDAPIFFGFGSMPVLDPQPLLDDVIGVTAALGRRAIVSENCVSPAGSGALPEQVRVVGALDHDRLFPQCAAVVHHGGVGSTTASVRAGRPTMVCSVFGDQPWWGEQMRRLGVGTHVPFRKLNRDALTSGLRTILAPEVDARARALGTAIQAEGDGLPTAAQLLEDWLVVAEPTPSPVGTRSVRWNSDNGSIKRNLAVIAPTALRSVEDLPGPTRLPLIGNAHQLLRTSRVHLVAEGWARRYGPIIQVKIGPRLMLAVSDADAINEILRDRPEGFRRWRDQQEVIEEIGPPGVFVAEGEDWKRQRRLVVTALNTHYLHRYFDVVRTSTERLRCRLREEARDGRALEIANELTSYTVDITSALALGHDLNTLERRDNQLQRHIQRVMQMTGRRLAAPVPYWRHFRLPADRALDRSALEMKRAIFGFIEQARARMDAEPERYEEPPNLLEGMIAARRTDGSFSDEDIVGNMFTILLAGEDTTANTLGWTIWLLASRPEIQARLAAEAREVLGDGELPVEHERIEKLAYAEAVVRESMRLKGVSPLLGVEPIEDTTICDTHIPAATRLLLLLRSAGRDAAGRSEEFYPERWLEDSDATRAPKSLAFGAGPRFCPGRNLAFLEAKAAIAIIIRDFEVELDRSARPVREAFEFAMAPKGLRVRLRERAR